METNEVESWPLCILLFIQIGTITFISIVATVLSTSANPGISQSWIYGGWSMLVLVSLLLIPHASEHHGVW
ncbi:hypothetical protein [Nitrosomonas sp. HPC101]|uniref:hypothetical protein n=1 Tax=Nitrosomonas sp. HPC101 TaxID=1658667 RepID=UPI00136EBD4F|nr:hypothetical protein [Nitrosomonas sp. HPC101]